MALWTAEVFVNSEVGNITATVEAATLPGAENQIRRIYGPVQQIVNLRQVNTRSGGSSSSSSGGGGLGFLVLLGLGAAVIGAIGGGGDDKAPAPAPERPSIERSYEAPTRSYEPIAPVYEPASPVYEAPAPDYGRSVVGGFLEEQDDSWGEE